MTHAKDRTLLASLGFNDPDKGDPRHDLGCQYLALPENAKKLSALALKRELNRATSRGFGTIEFQDPVEGHQERKAPYSSTHSEPRIVSRLEHPISKGSGQYKTTIGFLDVAMTAEFDVRREYVVDAHVNPEFVEVDTSVWVKPNGEPVDRKTVKIRWQDVPERYRDRLMVLENGYPRGKTEFECEVKVILDEPGEEPGPVLKRHGWVGKRAIALLPQYTFGKGLVPDTDTYHHAIGVEVKAKPVSIGQVLRQLKLYAEYESSIQDSFGARNATKWVLATAYPISTNDAQSLLEADITHVRLGEKFDEWAREQMESPKPAGGDGGTEI